MFFVLGFTESCAAFEPTEGTIHEDIAPIGSLALGSAAHPTPRLSQLEAATAMQQQPSRVSLSGCRKALDRMDSVTSDEPLSQPDGSNDQMSSSQHHESLASAPTGRALQVADLDRGQIWCSPAPLSQALLPEAGLDGPAEFGSYTPPPSPTTRPSEEGAVTPPSTVTVAALA